MKKLLLIVAALLLTIASYAQWSYRFLSQDKHFVYTSGDVVVGNKTSGKLGLNYVYNNKYIVNVGFSATAKTEAAIPNEILKSAIALIPANSTPAFVNSQNIHVMIGRVVKLNEEGTFRLLLQGGPGLYAKRSPSFTIDSNEYNYKMEVVSSLCLVVNPKVEIPLFSTLGVSAGPMAVINQNEKYFGAGIGIMYGIIGKN